MTLILSFFSFAEAQNKLYGPVAGIQSARKISPNGQYIVGATIRSVGYMWDLNAGTATTSLAPASDVFDVTDNGVAVGLFPDSELTYDGVPIVSGGVWENNAWKGIGLGIEDIPKGLGAGSTLRGVAKDGKMVVGYSKRFVGENYTVCPYSWENMEGNWVGTEWSQPSSVGQGSAIADVSADGKIAVGWTNIGLVGRTAILWTSPTNYKIYFEELKDDSYSEFTCISENGKYAGFKCGREAGIVVVETGEIITIPDAFLINAISNDGTAVGVYMSQVGDLEIQKAFFWNSTLNFIDFQEFIQLFASDVELDPVLSEALPPNSDIPYVVHTMTPDALSFTIWVAAGRVANLYLLKLEQSITLLPYPTNLEATVSREDRNKVLLTWEAPDTHTSPLKKYEIYCNEAPFFTIDDPTITQYSFESMNPGYFTFTVQAFYEDGSMSKKSNKTTAVVVDTYEIPFTEDFESLFFQTNYWTLTQEAGRSDWAIFEKAGVQGLNAGISIEVYSQQDNFSASLVSKPFDATKSSKVYISYMVTSDYIVIRDGFTADSLYLEIYDGVEWKEVHKYVFPAQTSIKWTSISTDVTDWVAGKLINFRLRLEGKNLTNDNKYYCLDEITISEVRGNGENVPQNIITKEWGEETLQLAWQDPSGLYGLTHMQTDYEASFGNDGVPFIAVHAFNAEDLAIYKGAFLNSISAYISEEKLQGATSTPTVSTTLRLAVFVNGTRVVNNDINTVNLGSWNTFILPNSLEITEEIVDLKVGVEVLTHDAIILPLGADAKGSSVAGKGDLYSEDGGNTWEQLFDVSNINFQRNWTIMANISEVANENEPIHSILGYNIYRDGVKLNTALVYQKNYYTDYMEGAYTIQAYSLETGLSAESEAVLIKNTTAINDEFLDLNAFVYPNPVTGDHMYIKGDFMRVTVFDYTGQKVKESTAASGQAVSVRDLANGLYIVVIETIGEKITQKVMIRK